MPSLTIIAGCNGAGKSVFAPSFLPENLASFDYDKVFLQHYHSMPDSEFRETVARDKTSLLFETLANDAMQNQHDFCYETNFDSRPMLWAERFRDCGFEINLIFICLDNQDVAKERVKVRTEFKGHFVDDQTIDLKWKAGYKNLNTHFKQFDNILLVDNSNDGQVYKNLLLINKQRFQLMTHTLPNYIEHRLPEIYREIIKFGF